MSSVISFSFASSLGERTLSFIIMLIYIVCLDPIIGVLFVTGLCIDLYIYLRVLTSFLHILRLMVSLMTTKSSELHFPCCLKLSLIKNQL